MTWCSTMGFTAESLGSECGTSGQTSFSNWLLKLPDQGAGWAMLCTASRHVPNSR